MSFLLLVLGTAKRVGFTSGKRLMKCNLMLDWGYATIIQAESNNIHFDGGGLFFFPRCSVSPAKAVNRSLIQKAALLGEKSRPWSDYVTSRRYAFRHVKRRLSLQEGHPVYLADSADSSLSVLRILGSGRRCSTQRPRYAQLHWKLRTKMFILPHYIEDRTFLCSVISRCHSSPSVSHHLLTGSQWAIIMAPEACVFIPMSGKKKNKKKQQGNFQTPRSCVREIVQVSSEAGKLLDPGDSTNPGG